MASCPTATVVGGGIAGLAAAVSLRHAGWEVTVLERAAEFGEVGTGLAITRNGMAALDAMGAGARVRDAGYETVVAGTQDLHGRWLLRLPHPDPGSHRAEAEPATRAWGVHRQHLHAALLDAADRVELVTRAHVLAVTPGQPGGDTASVTWRTGSSEHITTTDLVVAADGIRSTVRRLLFTGSRELLSYSGWTSWRAVITDSTAAREGFVAAWGPHTEFGTVRLSRDQVYWYGYTRHPEGFRFDDELAAAAHHFRDWSPWVRAAVAATEPGQLLRHDVHHLGDGLPAYVRGRVVITGDAAHAVLPTMGQGANSALEDGVCVGRIIGDPVSAGASLADALTAYDQARRPRCRSIARRSRLTARIGAHVGGGAPQAARNALLRLLPAGMVAHAGADLLSWTPP